MIEHIELDEDQKEFIKKHFVLGERLFDRIKKFEETSRGTVILITTSETEGIAAFQGENVLTIAYSGEAEVHFYRYGLYHLAERELTLCRRTAPARRWRVAQGGERIKGVKS